MKIKNLFEQGHLPPDQRRREGRPAGRLLRLAGVGRVRRHQGTRPAPPQVLLGLRRCDQEPEGPRRRRARSASGSRASSARASRTSSRCCRTCCGTARTRTTARASRRSSSSRARSRTPCSLGTSSGPSPRTPMSSSSTSTARPTTASGRDAILRVFLKVFNEMQGYCGDHPHIAHMERYLEGKGKLEAFHAAFREAHRQRLGRRSGTPTTSTGTRWSRRSRHARP